MTLASFGMITLASASEDVIVYQSGLLPSFKVAALDFTEDVQVIYSDASQIFLHAIFLTFIVSCHVANRNYGADISKFPM